MFKGELQRENKLISYERAFKMLENDMYKIVQISIFKVKYLENGLADLNDFGLILQDFERPFE